MKTKSALLMFVPVIMLTACRREYSYSYVVQRVDDNKITVKDSGENKTFVINSTRYDHLAYVYPGDTIEYRANSHNIYNGKIAYIPNSGYLKFNRDSLENRQNRRFYANTRYAKFLRQR